MRDYLEQSSVIHQTDGHHPEDGFVTPFMNFMGRVITAIGDENFRFIRGGTEESGKPDFKFQKRVGDRWRNTCLVEAKSHRQPLDAMATNQTLNNQQVYRYLQQSPHVLITNHFQFGLLNAAPGQWPPTMLNQHSLCNQETAQSFFARAANPPNQGQCNIFFQEFVLWIRENIYPLNPEGTTTRDHLHYAIHNLYSSTKQWLVDSSQNEDHPGSEIFSEIRERMSLAGIATTPEHINSVGAQIRVMGLILLRSQCTPQDFAAVFADRVNHLQSGHIRIIYNYFLTNPEIVTGANDVEYLSDCLIGCTEYDFTDVEQMESLYLHFLDFAEPGWRRRYGFTLTHQDVVDYMVSLAHHRLMEQGETFGTGDIDQRGILKDNETSRATVLDVAAGTGRYYVGVLRFIYNSIRNRDGHHQASTRVRRAIGLNLQGARIHAFDLQPACVMMTHFSLALFLNENNIHPDGLFPSIRLTDSLTGWTQADLGGASAIKQGSINVMIGNPPWSGYGTEQTPQDRTNLNTILTPWKRITEERYRQMNPPRKLPVTKDNPANAFIRIGIEKALRQNEQMEGAQRPCVCCFITPQSFAERPPMYGGRRQLSMQFDVSVDLLGGDMNAAQGQNIFSGLNATPVANFISCFSVSPEPRFRRRVMFEGTAVEKRHRLVQDSTNIGNILWEAMQLNDENLFRFFGGEADQPAWPTIEQIQMFHTQGPQEQRGYALMHPVLNNLIEVVNQGIYSPYEDACAYAPDLWLGQMLTTGQRRTYSRFDNVNTHAHINEVGYNEDWFRQGTIYPFNHLRVYLPGPEVPANRSIWNEKRPPALSHSRVGGMILIPSSESKETHVRVAFAPHMALSSHPVFENARAIPLTVISDTQHYHLRVLETMTGKLISQQDLESNLLDLGKVNGITATNARWLIEAGIEDTLCLIKTDTDNIVEAYNGTNVRNDITVETVNVWKEQVVDYAERITLARQFINGEQEQREIPNLSSGVMTLLTENGFDVNNQLSRNIWHHVLAIMSSPAYNDEPFVEFPGGKENRIPIPESSDILDQSAALGRIIAALHTLDELPESEMQRNTSILGFIDSELFGFADVTDLGRSPEEIIEHGVRLSEIHSKTNNISHRGYTYYNEPRELSTTEPFFEGIAGAFNLDPEEVVAILGGEVRDLMLNENIVLRGVPGAVCDLTIGTYRVLGQWLAWRSPIKVHQQPIPGIHTDLTRLIRYLTHFLLLSGELNENYRAAMDNALEYNHNE